MIALPLLILLTLSNSDSTSTKWISKVQTWELKFRTWRADLQCVDELGSQEGGLLYTGEQQAGWPSGGAG